MISDVTGYRVSTALHLACIIIRSKSRGPRAQTISHLIESKPYFFVVISYDYRGVLSLPPTRSPTSPA
jgi:hypothetical protein